MNLLVFDLDGTLVDSKDDIALAVNLTMKELGLPTRDTREIYGFIGGGVHNLILKSIKEENARLLDEGVDIFWANYKEHVMDTTLPYPGVPDMLDSLSGYPMALVTNKPYAHTVLLLEGLGLKRYFLSVQGWKMGLRVKPDPELLVRALTETGTKAGDAVMIGDGLSDVLAARAAGARSCAVGYGYGEKERLLEAGPDYFVEDVKGIAEIFGRLDAI